MMIKKSHMIGT